MTETKFTPGPWKVGEISKGTVPPNGLDKEWDYKSQYVLSAKDEIIGEVMAFTVSSFRHNLDEVEHNAKLMAAAPSLLSALELMYAAFTEGEDLSKRVLAVAMAGAILQMVKT